jgi:hypothetical protein
MSKRSIGVIAAITFTAVLLISLLDEPWQEALTAGAAVGLTLYLWGLTHGDEDDF